MLSSLFVRILEPGTLYVKHNEILQITNHLLLHSTTEINNRFAKYISIVYI